MTAGLQSIPHPCTARGQSKDLNHRLWDFLPGCPTLLLASWGEALPCSLQHRGNGSSTIVLPVHKPCLQAARALLQLPMTVKGELRGAEARLLSSRWSGGAPLDCLIPSALMAPGSRWQL